ncbi:hypothetical protein L6452_29859 [Arctium lappa]|uniref:Uncharacterized protein n=1 Tax=Arctium lappa TaxID=4217 RepID=A0ACB8ZIF2_ARCLA|nr:hypothetical protein L6452_29859 [Arctium lappa]
MNDGGNDTVVVHCQSKDDDTGEKTIGFNQSVDWKFCENILDPRTLFFCHFHMDNKQQVFDVYNKTVKLEYVEKPKRDYWRCTCLIKRDGFYFVHWGDMRQEIKVYN